MRIAANKVISVMCVAGLGIGASVVQAAANSCTEQPKVASEMSEGVFHGIEDAMGLLSKQKYTEAIEKLSKMADSGSDYEKAVVNYNLGLAYASTNKHPEAVKAFAKALSMNALPQSQREQLQFNLGQLYIVAM